MYFVEKKVINEYCFFIIRSEKDYSVKDFFLFSENNYIPVYEKFIFEMIDEILLTSFSINKYKKKQMRFYLGLHDIFIESGYKINFKNMSAIKKGMNVMKKTIIGTEYLKYFETKKTKTGLDSLLNLCLKEINKINSVEMDEDFCSFVNFFADVPKKQLIYDTIKLFVQDEYEKGKKNVVSYEQKMERKVENYKNIKKYLSYYNDK